MLCSIDNGDVVVRLLVLAGSEEDAEPLLKEIERAGLELASCRVETIETLPAALQQGTWHLALLDEGAPGGVDDALRLLRAGAPALPAVVVGAKPSEEAAVRALRAGAQDYVSRQHLERLGSVVRCALCTDETGPDGAPCAGRARCEPNTHKMEALARLAHGVAHDLNNLLTIIKGYSAMAHDALPEYHHARRDMAEVMMAADRATALSRQLTLLASRQPLARRVWDLNELVLGAHKMLCELVGGGEDGAGDERAIHLELDLSPDTLPVAVDAAQLRRVLASLARNTRDAMPDGGQLAIRTRRRRPDDRLGCGGSGVIPGERAQLVVRDTGAGMSADVLEHLFEPYYTTKRGHGLGLGLAVVYGIVRRHDGCIAVQSLPGLGTTISICLPRAQEGGQAPPPGSLRTEGGRS